MEQRHVQENSVHLLLVSYPIQGHVAPFIKSAYLFAGRGIKVTLVITEFVHARLAAAHPELYGEQYDQVRIVAVPGGLPKENV